MEPSFSPSQVRRVRVELLSLRFFWPAVLQPVGIRVPRRCRCLRHLGKSWHRLRGSRGRGYRASPRYQACVGQGRRSLPLDLLRLKGQRDRSLRSLGLSHLPQLCRIKEHGLDGCAILLAGLALHCRALLHAAHEAASHNKSDCPTPCSAKRCALGLVDGEMIRPSVL